MPLLQHGVEVESEFVCYIDEAGDEGFGKLRQPGAGGQSKWLFLGAAVVSVENDRLMPQWRDEILALFPSKKLRDLHFKNLSHPQRTAAAKYLSEKQIGVCVVGSNKITIIGLKQIDVYKRKGHLYNYLVRYLLERVTSACYYSAQMRHDKNAQMRAVFSRRGGTDYNSMKQYLELLRSGREFFQ